MPRLIYEFLLEKKLAPTVPPKSFYLSNGSLSYVTLDDFIIIFDVPLLSFVVSFEPIFMFGSNELP